MPQNPFSLGPITGLSSFAGATTYTKGYPYVMLDYMRSGAFAVSFTVTVTTTSTQAAAGGASDVVFNVEGTNDYQGQYSSNINGFLSSAATWWPVSSLWLGVASSGASSQINIGLFTQPFTAMRLNVTSGASVGTITLHGVSVG